MKLWKMLLLSLPCALVTACGHPGLTDYHHGNEAFACGDYKASLKAYLSSARVGYAPAQYAVGYQYYYGLGVKQNDATGIIWFKRAAPHSLSAEYALDLIHRNSPKIPWIKGLQPPSELAKDKYYPTGPLPSY